MLSKLLSRIYYIFSCCSTRTNNSCPTTCQVARAGPGTKRCLHKLRNRFETVHCNCQPEAETSRCCYWHTRHNLVDEMGGFQSNTLRTRTDMDAPTGGNESGRCASKSLRHNRLCSPDRCGFKTIGPRSACIEASAMFVVPLQVAVEVFA